MRGEVRCAAIKLQRAPTTTERGNTAVAILHTTQPREPGLRRTLDLVTFRREVMQRDERASSVVCIRNSTGKIRPRPRPRRGTGVGMHAFALLVE